MFGLGFTPGASGTIAVTTTSQAVDVTGIGKTLYVNNVGATECFVDVGDSTVTATAGGAATGMGGGMSFPPGFSCAIGMDGNTHIAAVCATGTTTLRFTRGDGQ
ncbi:hypothetical protein [Rhizobium sp. BT-175]|uniref:hypothetical protein n=1 Tax=Rhizobium sp. BT-175 TaxID=2986929 RepID=UPI002235F7D9|nr:hypothetical protein [Rhizobium sp. BT-175]MCV9943003.1 hypothetical protein [Rhizobium sp. BT-175]